MVYNEDCLKGLNRLGDNSVDAIICDLPFGVTNASFDKRLPFAPMWQEFNRVSKANAPMNWS